LGKWGIERIHFLIPVLVGILILSVATVPSAFAGGGLQYLLGYEEGKITIFKLKSYEDGFEKVWSDDKWDKDWTHFLQFYMCKKSSFQRYDCNDAATPYLFSYKSGDGTVQISKIKDGGEGLEKKWTGNLKTERIWEQNAEDNVEFYDSGLGLEFFGSKLTSPQNQLIFAYSEKQGKLIHFFINEDPEKGIESILSSDFGKGWTHFAPTFVFLPGLTDSQHWLLSYKTSDGAVKVSTLETYQPLGDNSIPAHFFKEKFTDKLPTKFTAVTSLNDFFGTFFVFWQPVRDNWAENFYILGQEKGTNKPVVGLVSKDSKAYVSKYGGQSVASYVTLDEGWFANAVWVDHERNFNTIRVTTDFATKLKTSMSPEKLDFGTPCDKVFGCPEQVFASLWLPFKPSSASVSLAGVDGCWYCTNPGCFVGSAKEGNMCLIDLEKILQEPFFKCLKGDLTKVGEKFLCVTDLIEKP